MSVKNLKPRNGPGRATNDEIITFWVEHTAEPGVEMPVGRASVFTGGKNDDTIYSFGTHFPLARIMAGPRGKPRGWFLVNGDRRDRNGGGHTSTQQAYLRRYIDRSGLPFMIVPFSVLSLAGIYADTIRRIEVLPDRMETIRRREFQPQVPSWIWDNRQYDSDQNRGGLHQLPDGRWEWTDGIHVLGESLFTAEYDADRPNRGEPPYRRPVQRRGLFLSAFDRQEPGLSYFLCELPRGSRARTVTEAFEALKPPQVVDAERDGLAVLRQGDVYAIPVTDTKRQLKSGGTCMERHMTYVLSVNHVATEVLEIPGGTYARGALYHKPRDGRRPDHVTRVLGDRKTWHVLVKNTVPVDERGQNRAWSVEGNRGRVD